MFDRSERKILIGLVTGALFSTAVTSVVAVEGERESHHLLDSQGKPVMTSREAECVQTPNTPNDPTLRLKECGDIVDSDGDGIPDDEDACPHNTKEELAGVDTDGDGIDDGVYTDGPQKGCPKDTDGDTIEDYRDECPNSPPEIVQADGGRGTCINLDPSDSVTLLGCTKDSDNDGVPDCLDDCPNTPAGKQVNNRGCAVVEKGETVILQGDVTFEFDKFNLTPQAMATLDAFASRAVADLTRFADILVEGHTDSVGSDSYNQTLSEKRAASVKNYLISRGIPANKVISAGKGEKQPIADNNTTMGRAQNRRVELRVR
jgi:OOP family OmpA-OmpF porin